MNKLLQVVDEIERVKKDRFNPETFITSRKVVDEDMMFTLSYLLGNLYIKGVFEGFEPGGFEIFKDHSTWQVWIWGETKPVLPFSCPEDRFDKVKHFIETTFLKTK